MAAWKIGPALAVGNTVVLKPASISPLTAIEMARAALQASIPEGVLNVLAGMKIMEQAASTVKRLHLEPGGKAPFIVFEDADLDTAVQGAVVAGFVNPEQACTAGTRVISRSRSTNLRWINDHLPMASEMPHGGVKKPGLGSGLSRYSFKEYTNVKHVMANLTGDVRKGWHFTVYGGQG